MTALPPASPVTEPKSLADAFKLARLDIAKPSAEALLRWTFWHAIAVGRLELARTHLAELNLEVRSLRACASTMFPSPQRDNVMANLPAPEQMGKADEAVSRAAEMEQACRSVVELLKGRR